MNIYYRVVLLLTTLWVLLGIGLMVFPPTAFAQETSATSSVIQLHNGLVSMPLELFNNIVLLIKTQTERIAHLTAQLNSSKRESLEVEECVRKNIDDKKLVLTCFGDKEI